MVMKNLIYFSVFLDVGYGDLLAMLLKSMNARGHFNPETTDLLIMTHPSMQDAIVEKVIPYGFKIHFWFKDFRTLFEAAAARLYIFEYPLIDSYDKVLYLDTDILVTSNINRILDLPIESGKIYGPENLKLDSPYHGCQFYANPPEVDLSQPAYCTGILLFHNCSEIKDLFKCTREFIQYDLEVRKNPIPCCQEQPYLVYMSAIKKVYDARLLNDYVYQGRPETFDENIVLYHFMGDLGSSYHKNHRMTEFLQKVMDFKPSMVST